MAQDLIRAFETAQEVAEAVAKDFIAFTNTCIAESGSAVVAISGGTTPNTLFELLNPMHIVRNWIGKIYSSFGWMSALCRRPIRTIISIVPKTPLCLYWRQQSFLSGTDKQRYR